MLDWIRDWNLTNWAPHKWKSRLSSLDDSLDATSKPWSTSVNLASPNFHLSQVVVWSYSSPQKRTSSTLWTRSCIRAKASGVGDPWTVWPLRNFWDMLLPHPFPLVGCHLPHAVLRQRSLYDTGPQTMHLFFSGIPSKPTHRFASSLIPPKMVLWSHLMTYAWLKSYKPHITGFSTSSPTNTQQTTRVSGLLFKTLLSWSH